MPRLDLTPAPIALPHDLSPNARSQGRYWPRDFRPWLTPEALRAAALDMRCSGIGEDALAAIRWDGRDFEREVNRIRRILRDGGAR